MIPSLLIILLSLSPPPGDSAAADEPALRSVPMPQVEVEAVPLTPRSGLPADPTARPGEIEAPVPARPEGDSGVPTGSLEAVRAELVRVAVGFSPEAPGTKAEKETVAALERSSTTSTRPSTEVRRLRAGAPEPRRVCREGLDDLVIVVGYLPDRDDPVLLSHDCRLDLPLGVRSTAAATDPDLVATLWAEHHKLVAEGAKERHRRRLNPKIRNGLIIGGAALVIGGAVALLLVNALSRETVVLNVSPR